MTSRMPRLAMQAPMLGVAAFSFTGEPGRQAPGIVLTGCPDALMAPLETIHAPGWPGTVLAVSVPMLIAAAWKNDGPLTTARLGGRRCGRTASGMAIWTAAKTASVTAMAGTARRMRAPVTAPRVKANAA